MFNISIILKRVIASFNESGYNCKMTEIPLKEGLEGQICESCLKGNHKSYGTYHLPKKDNKGNWIDHNGDIIDPEDSELQRYSCKNEGNLNGHNVQCLCSPTWLESIEAWNKKLGFKGTIDEYAQLEQIKGLQRAIKDREGKIFTDPMKGGHKNILIQIAKIKPSEETFLRHELFKDNAGKYSPYIGFINNKGEFMSREEAEKIQKENIEKPKSFAQLFHYSTITGSLRHLADILNPSIKNPLPAVRKEAEAIYQDFIASEEGKAIYKKVDKKNFLTKVEMILNSLRPKISEVAGDDPNKFQLLNACLRDKISEGLR